MNTKMLLLTATFAALEIGCLKLAIGDSDLWPISSIEATYDGSGCPQGSFGPLTLERGGDSIHIPIDYFEANADRKSGVSAATANCNITIRLHLAEGWSVALPPLKTTIFAGLSMGTTAEARIEAYFDGSPIRRTVKKLRGELFDEIPFHQGITEFDWSPCGKDVTLHYNISISARRPKSRENAAIALYPMENYKEPYLVFNQVKRCRQEPRT